MPMSPTRWTTITESRFPWERDALEWLRSQLPDHNPWHAWSNFEFIDDDGRVNEVDGLILTPAGLFLMEIKSRPGVLTGDPHTWTWSTDGKSYSDDNPLILADRKAKRLASLLRRLPSVQRSRARIPFIRPCVFLCAADLICRLSGTAAAGVYLRGQPGSSGDHGIIGALTSAPALSNGGDGSRIDQAQARILAQAMAQAGIRPSNKHRLVGDYQLGALLAEGETHQDWEGQHRSIESIRRRVRIYTYAAAATAQARAALVRQATREFQILEGIDHPGILKVRDYKESEQGPALIFDHDPRSRRLDLLLREHGDRLNVSQRLHLVRHLAETLQYAHGKRLFHRALCPQSILVRDPESQFPSLQIMNWRTGAREWGTGGSLVADGARTVGTLHVQDCVEDPGRVYLAPETAWHQHAAQANAHDGAQDITQDINGAARGTQLDVFSLGAIAYHLFSGQPPAGSVIEQLERLRAGPGLRISDVIDGAGPALQDLIQLSTLPDTDARYPSVDDFLKDLEVLEDALTTPDPETTVDPATATANDRLEGGFTVLRRLGKGSSSDVLLVRADGTPDGSEAELVLKVASDPSHNDRLVAEGEALAKLHRNPNVVEWRRTLRIAGRTALLMCRAGDQTLAKRLEEDQRLSLDLASRFGEELIQVVDCLEGLGIAHRDIKPQNIGIAQSAGGRLQLILFDFSLTSASPENITAGTHPYLDPFLPLRKPPRWDLAAERFALAVTLYEMLTGELPHWGDGVSQAAMLDCEVSLNTNRFDPHLRDALTDFFERALHRDYRERFDNAEELLRTWRQAFAGAQGVGAEPDSLAALARLATAATSIADLGYSVEAQNVLDGMGIHNLRDLLAVDRIKFRYLSGVGDRIRKEIRLKAKKLLQLRPDLGPDLERVPTTVRPNETPGIASIDALASQLLPKRPAGDDRPQEQALAIYLGLEPAADGTDSSWPTLGAAAQTARLARSALSDTLLKARERWLKLAPLTQVRGEIETLLDAHAGVMTVPELALVLLAARGCAHQDDALRLRLATALVRACQEAEGSLAKPRYQLFEQDQVPPLLALGPDQADYARRLGAAADAVAMADPLLTPPHARKTLEALERPSSIAPLSVQRLLRLATAASRTAALSSRQEVYPQGMPALRAMRLSLGALTGPRYCQARDIRVRIQGRFPACEPIPDRPALDALLAEAGAALTWDPSGPQGPGYYSPAGRAEPTAGTTTWLSRHGTRAEPLEELTADDALIRQFEDRLERARTTGGFLALTVPPRLARHAEAQLLRCHRAARLSLDALLIQTLHDQAKSHKVNWEVVLQADAAAPGSRDWTNLTRLVQKALPQVRQRLLDANQPLLLVDPGLLARYQLMGLVEALRDRTGQTPPPLWLLVPMHADGLPAVDGVPVPVISSAQWARIPPGWIEHP
ncbi:BREX system serine/threonine kinase PglW [uncultured Thiodictyon sp.]|uniref:BREX system serine/threonine kinase PglW n=1 Tax=uncultured Thiodictyon sp. TaxID=1846217 RepID=UPI0025FA1C12|nr:BREX system serine/threonine kinase PglW [uncultured Thiodictyon sp.]